MDGLSQDNLIIAVMGVIGAGKSTFIPHCTSSGQGPVIGHDIAKLCGEGARTRVILATTMWENVDLADGDLRETQLIETRDFWGFMCEKGSQVFRHYNNKESALKLLSYFASDRSQKMILDIQRELVDGRKTLDETRVGKELGSTFAAERMKLEHELKQLKEGGARGDGNTNLTALAG
ncbi:hypothetical protein F4679DRAFT_60730 [Xylaria curta]|nr:hypothetical protein F4679DRAFT_60730 [Xylaria curta]